MDATDTCGDLVANLTTAWAERAADLADWVIERLTNTTDHWGQYLPLKARKVGADGRTRKAVTHKVPLTREHLETHFRGADVGDIVGLHAKGEEGSIFLGIDLDN